MKECWINYYINYGYGCPLDKREALLEAYNMLDMFEYICAYRIHVRLK